MSKFNVSNQTETKEEGSGSFMEIGIHDNVVLKEVNYITPGEDSQGDWEEGIEIVFESTVSNIKKDTKGNPVKEDGALMYISKKGDIARISEVFNTQMEGDPEYDEKVGKKLQRIAHIIKKIQPEFNIEAETIPEFVEQLKTLVTEDDKKTKLQLKVIANNQYASIPKYMPFVQNMEEIKKDPTKALSISTREMQKPAAMSAAQLGGMGTEYDLPPIN